MGAQDKYVWTALGVAYANGSHIHDWKEKGQPKPNGAVSEGDLQRLKQHVAKGANGQKANEADQLEYLVDTARYIRLKNPTNGVDPCRAVQEEYERIMEDDEDEQRDLCEGAHKDCTFIPRGAVSKQA